MDVKQLNITVPDNAPKRRHRVTRKTSGLRVVPTPTIPVGGSTVGQAPMPMLSTTTAVGGKKKKPTLKVPLPYAESPSTPSPVELVPAKKSVAKAASKIQLAPAKKKAFTVKRKFKNKRVTLSVENASKVRSTYQSVDKRVAAMKLADITKQLREKGLIREKANPPEGMQRSLMKDLLLMA